MVSNMTMLQRTDITSTLQIADFLDVCRKLSRNLTFGGDVETIPSYLECFTGNISHKDVGIVNAPVVIRVAINRTVRITCENLRYGNPCIFRNIRHVFSLDKIDMRTNLDDDFG